MATLPWVVRDDRDRVVGFWGLTVIETPHRLPFLLGGEEISIESTCPTTGDPITLTVSPEGIRDVSPASAAVSLVVPGEGFTGESTQVIKNACHFIHFFASDRAAEAWTAQHEGAFAASSGVHKAFVLSIQDAFELAARSLTPRLVAEGGA